MKIILPVAGEGTRLRPHTYATPKPLLPVAGKTVLEHVLDPALALNPEEVVFVVGYRRDNIQDFVREHYSFKARFVPQNELLGLGYALKLALDEIDNEPVLIILGDTIVDCDLNQFVATGDLVLGLHTVDDPTRFGIAEVENGVITRLEEKPETPVSNRAVIGLYYVKDSAPLKRALNELVASGKKTQGEIQLTDALEMMIARGARFLPFEVEGWHDCGKIETLLETNATLLARLQSPVIKGSVVIPPVHVAAGACINQCVIGPNVSVLAGTVIEHSIIKNSIIGEKSSIRNVVIRDSLIGNEVELKGEFRIANIGDRGVIDKL